MIRLSISVALLGFIGYITLAHAETPRMQDNDEVECLALNIYHEARSESLAGQYAVADVTLNRVQDRRYPSTICGVVKQAVLSQWGLDRGLEIPRRNMCQFSWYCDGLDDLPTDSKTWMQSLYLADRVLFGEYKDITEGSLWYHSDAVTPYWSKHLNLVTTIDNHLFYN